MPYKSNAELPDQTSKLSAKEKTAWRKAFNAAFHGSCNGDDGCAARIAWSAVNKESKHMTDEKRKQLIAQYAWAMAGKFPEIATKPGVDIDELTSGDGSPVFVTLPIAVKDGVADDGFTYTDEFVEQMYHSIMTETITANMGHLSPSSRSTDFPVPVAFWVGAHMAADGKLWAKAYISDPEVAAFVRKLKATNSTIATSIYGTYTLDDVTSHGGGNWSVDPRSFTLEHVDFAPPKRAALDIAGRDMTLTKHTKGNKMTSKAEFLAQLTPDQLPPTLVDQLHNKSDVGLIEQMKAESEAQKATIAQLSDEVAGMKSELFTRRIDTLVHSSVKVDSKALRDYVATKVLAQAKPESTPEEIQKLVDDTIAGEDYSQLASGVLANISGGKPFSSSVQMSSGKSIADSIMENLEDVVGQFGVKANG